MGAQGLAIVARVVHLQAGFRLVVCLDNGLEGARRLDGVMGVNVKEAAKSIEGHAGSVRFPVRRIAGYVRSADEDLVQKFEVDVRFVFPHVDDRIGYAVCAQGIQQGLRLNDFAPRSIDEDYARL